MSSPRPPGWPVGGLADLQHRVATLAMTLDASRGFQWDADPDQSFDWMIRFIDRGLRDTSAP